VRKLFMSRPQLPAAAILVLAIYSWSMAAPAADFSKYHTYAEMTATLQSLVKEHANIAKLVEVGKTRENRSIWAVEIMNQAGSTSPTRPALLVAANFEGDHLVGSELAVYMIDCLLTNYATNPQVKQQIDTHAFYIIPRVNPDGAEFFFAGTKSDRKANTSPLDDDNDGRIDENAAEDLNQDGFITLMRVKDPKGAYIIHPEDARLLRRADPQRGETGAYRVYHEGLDKDNDGFIAEDGAGGADLNRNFMHKYPYYQTDAGRYMTSELESRALMEYLIHHRNIAAILTFGESDNLIAGRNGDNAPAQTIDLLSFAQQSITESRRVGTFAAGGGGRGFGMGGRGGGGEMPPAGGARGAAGATATATAGGRGGGMGSQRPAETINAQDAEYMQTIADKYRELTGLRNNTAVRTPAGAFYEVGYYQFGVPSFSTPGWGLPAAAGGGARGGMAPDMATAGGGRGMAAAGGRGAGTGAAATDGAATFDLRLLRWMDAEKIDGFVNWTPFKHPTLGDVEIGGFKPYAMNNPPVAKIAELGRPHADFAVYLASLFPKIGVAEFTAANLGGGLFRIKAEVQNTGFLPTSMAQGQVARTVRATMVQLSLPQKDIVSGDSQTNNMPILAGSGRRQSYQWIVKAKPGTTVTLKVVAQKGGTDTATITLK
jgi:hypothetical protein